MGLNICSNILKQLNGSIWFHSDGVDKGTTFTFTMPMRSSPERNDALKIEEEEEVKEQSAFETFGHTARKYDTSFQSHRVVMQDGDLD